ncbi:MAG: phosphoglycerate dehydrogenase [Spirochaetaceae bacterium]|nr:phosphoglycerate dehydrogenase [Spirochaetaceae bacterium]
MQQIAIITTAFGFGLQDRREYYKSLFERNGFDAIYCTRDDLIEGKVDPDGVIVGVEKADRAFFEACKKLKVAMKFGVGLDNFDLEFARKKNIKILNMPGINSEAVAEMTIALMLNLSRRICEANYTYKSGSKAQFIAHTVVGKTLGIIGTGSVGQKVVELSRGLRLRYLGYDLFQNEKAKTLGIEYVSFERLIRESDIITLHIPLTDQSHHIIGEKEFKQMKKDAILINTSRGGVVDENALLVALEHNQIGGAGLDVFEWKQSPAKISSLPNLICTPHIAAYTHETLRKMEETAILLMAEALHADSPSKNQA